MTNGIVERFLHALSPAHREVVEKEPRERQEELAEAWEEELRDDAELFVEDELSPPAAESEAAARVYRRTYE
ncbi:hypothetical protein [Streptomyces sp. NRRL S-87]|uniref:hypothetical protein n=1 Tax=Streptomyces sp. NRRL S-87 TaxID=1463920 RepID=UPI0004C27F1F|nr:hypothetical protein [Streptomyces sp. NRRL S-87]